MKTKLWAILVVFLSTFINSFAQLLYKIGADNLVLDLSILTNWYLILGLACYGVSFLILTISLKHGELSVLYPIIASGFIWVALLSNIFFSEPLNSFKVVGIGFVILGISFIGIGGNRR